MVLGNDRSRGGHRRVLFAAGGVVLALVLAVLASEVLVRVAKRFVCSGRGASLYAPDPVLGWSHVAGAADWQWGCLGRRFEFRNYVEINSIGLRDHELASRPAAGASRVLLLGDSITEAVQVRLEETFAKRLEARLSTPARPVEVINAGVAAYSTDNELLFYRERGRSFGAELVVLMLNLQNDVAENHPQLFDRMYGALGLEMALVKADAVVAPDGSVSFDTEAPESHVRSADTDELGRPTAWSKRLARWFYVVRLLGRLGETSTRATPAASELPITFGMYETPPDPIWVRAWARTGAFVAALRREVESAGARFLVVVVPAKEMIDSRWWRMFVHPDQRRGASTRRLDFPRERIDAMLAEAGIDAFDLTPALRAAQEEGEGDLFFQADIHLAPRGHEAVARALAPIVASRLSPAATGVD